MGCVDLALFDIYEVSRFYLDRNLVIINTTAIY